MHTDRDRRRRRRAGPGPCSPPPTCRARLGAAHAPGARPWCPSPRERPRPRAARSAEADEAIVRATLEVLLEEGFRGLSVDAVRQRAGVGKATIYRRFPDKDALVVAAIRSLHKAVDEPPDTGSLEGDVHELFAQGYLSDPRITSFAPGCSRRRGQPEMHAIFRSALIEPRRAFLGCDPAPPRSSAASCAATSTSTS
jgi:AcrR family transcriptional regulator